MTDREIHRLRNRLQAGVMLVDNLLRTHGSAVSRLDPSLTRSLRSWVTTDSSEHVVRLQCGQLRRESDGGWWWGTHFLGTDGDPQTSVNLADDSGLVVIALAAALDRAAGRLDVVTDGVGFRAARRVLSRYHHWQSTGVW